MPSRVFKEKQLRLCVVAALTTMAAPVAESLILPPKPLASNLSWRCDSGILTKRFCSHSLNPDYRYAGNFQQQTLIKRENAVKRESTVAAVINPSAIRNNVKQSDRTEFRNNQSVANQLLTLPGNQYVLQWMAAKERGQLEALKQRYPVLKNSLIAQYERSGNVWFVLLDGPFDSRAQAMAQLESPPRSAMASELYPWARSLASLQKLDTILTDPSYQIADNYQQRQEPTASNMPLLATTDFNVPYVGQEYIGQEYAGQEHVEPDLYSNQQRPSRQIEVIASRQNDLGYRQPSSINYAQPVRKQGTTLPYGTEFDANEATYSYGNNTHSDGYQVLPRDAAQDMYVGIGPAYGNSVSNRQHMVEPDYNVQANEYTAASQPANPARLTADPFGTQSQYGFNVLTANPGSYTIEWMSSGRRSSLERAQLRYKELQDTQIVRYTVNNRQRFSLVSLLFVNRADALDALLTPTFARISTRFSPKVRQVAYLQTLVGNTLQNNNAWFKPSMEPSLQKRRWIGTEDPGDKEYLVDAHPMIKKPVFRTQEKPQPIRKLVVRQQPVSAPTTQQKLNALLNTPNNAYTIQWFSSSRLSSIQKLKQRYPQLNDALIVRVQKDKRHWFVLVQGQYRNSQEAIRAMKTPAMQNIATVLHPWTRPVGSLKKLSVATL